MKRFVIFFCGLISTVFILVGSLFIWSGLPRTRSVVCRRTENKTIDCQFSSTVAGFAAREANLRGLQTVETYSAPIADENGDFMSFGVNLNFENETETLDNMTERSARELKMKFENFINSPQQERLIIENTRRDWLRISAGGAVIFLMSSLTVSGLKRKPEIDAPPV